MLGEGGSGLGREKGLRVTVGPAGIPGRNLPLVPLWRNWELEKNYRKTL